MSAITPESDVELQPLDLRLSQMEDSRRSTESICTLGRYTSSLNRDNTCGLVGVIASGKASRSSESDAANPTNHAQNMNGTEDHKETIGHMKAAIERDSEVVPKCDVTGIASSSSRQTQSPRDETSKSSHNITGNEPVENETQSRMSAELMYKAAWRPFWLRREVMVVFTTIYLIITATILAMVWVSWRYESIGKARQSFALIWRFGPTTILTILAAFWGRVEFQTMRYTPWIALSMAKTSIEESIYVLDYTSMSTPAVLIRSFQRKHPLVFLSSVLSLVLKIQIALAPGLLSLIDVSFNKAVAVNVLDSFDMNTSFKDAYSRHFSEDASPYYIPQAIEYFGMEYPFGVSNKPPIAYQTFELQDTDFDSSTRETDRSMQASVDGLFADLQCRKLENYSVWSVREENPFDNMRAVRYDVDLRFQGCDESFRKTVWQELTPGYESKPYFWTLETQRGVFNVSCSSLPQQAMQFIYFAALPKASPTNSSLMEISAAAAIICSSVAWTEKVTVIFDSNSTSVTNLTDQIKIPVAADLWQLMLVSFPSDSPFRGDSDGMSGPIAMDRYKGKFVDPTDPLTYNSDAMLESTLRLFYDMSPFISHFRLRKGHKHETAGSVIFTSQMISVNHRVGIPMTALFAIATCVAFYSVFRGTLGTPMAMWRRDPATTLGSIAFLHENPRIMKEFPVLNYDQHQPCWGRSNFLPVVLRVWVRASFTVFVLGTIVALGCIQRLSDTSHGFATVSAQALAYTYLLWTSVPALTMLVVSTYISSCNATWKSMFPFWILSSRACTTSQLNRPLLDVIAVRAFYRSLRLGAYSITVSQLLAIASMVLTTLASILYTVRDVQPQPRSFAFQQASQFGTTQNSIPENLSKTRKTLSSLLIHQGDANFTYPRNTYHDLLFPAVEPEDGFDEETVASLTSSNILAAQLQSNCARILGNLHQIVNTSRRPTVEVTFPYTCSDGSTFNLSFSYPIRVSAGYAYFGRSMPQFVAASEREPDCKSGIGQPPRRDDTSTTQHYLWGAYSWDSNDLSSLSVWECNYTWSQVEVEVGLQVNDGHWSVDPKKPPKLKPSPTRPWHPAFRIPNIIHNATTDRYSKVSSAFPDVRFTEDRAFEVSDQVALQIQPYGKFPVEALGDPEKEAHILMGLRQNFAFITAQLANIESRTEVADDVGDGAQSNLSRINVIINYKSQKRLTQQLKPACAIIALLSTILAFHIWGLLSTSVRRFGKVRKHWLLEMDVKGLAPEGFNSLAANFSLLRDSNVYLYLPPVGRSVTEDELGKTFSRLKFRMGWFQTMANKETRRVFTVGAVDDENFMFMSGKNEGKLRDKRP